MIVVEPVRFGQLQIGEASCTLSTQRPLSPALDFCKRDNERERERRRQRERERERERERDSPA